MIFQQLPDIPRLYTACAEWSACALYALLFWDTRIPRRHTVTALLLGLPLLIFIQFIAGKAPIELWIPGMLAAIITMACIIWMATGENWVFIGHLTTRAFVFAELVASFSWHLVVWSLRDDSPTHPSVIFLSILIHAVVITIVWFSEKRHFPREEPTRLLGVDLWSAIAITAITFAMSNLSFITVTTPFSGRAGSEIFYIRTLVDLCGFILLYAQQERLRQITVTSELATMNAVLHAQHTQYLQAKANIEAAARVRHDMKHQIALIRDEVDSDRTHAYLSELERTVGALRQQYHCGNPVLDVILTSKADSCAASDITFTAVVDGTLVSNMTAMDIATLFGNALDNAIEASMRVEAPEQRLINVALHSQGTMVVLRVDNWFDGHVEVDEAGDLRTVKNDNSLHGYGIRSIRWTAHKYGGEVTTHIKNHWFTLTVLLPSTIQE
ncbi:ATP-binding protein [Schaalia sp. lx-100]|uniref:ATP-binding protein n=1 Tax=Schaalia sp. lx-100 TaxID=2899081 RepID=UPI001E5B1C78|nr:ATP-binding protein [Schaalia sp. lx-100]MCD4558211.1 ATP-binding protein [Schaalia sp. lx-100]